jgi:hypothetical protein
MTRVLFDAGAVSGVEVFEGNIPARIPTLTTDMVNS